MKIVNGLEKSNFGLFKQKETASIFDTASSEHLVLTN